MHDNNLFSHIPVEEQVYPSADIADRPVFSSAANDNRTTGDVARDKGTERR